MSFQSRSPQQQRERYLRRAVGTREFAEKLPEGLRPSVMAVAQSWERLAGEVVETGRSKPKTQVTVYRRASEWLQKNGGLCFCDECIARDVDAARANVAAATRRLATERGFSKYTGRCDSCGTVKMVARASPIDTTLF